MFYCHRLRHRIINIVVIVVVVVVAAAAIMLTTIIITKYSHAGAFCTLFTITVQPIESFESRLKHCTVFTVRDQSRGRVEVLPCGLSPMAPLLDPDFGLSVANGWITGWPKGLL